MKEISTFQQLKEESQRSGWLLIYFTASWCGPCATFSPIMEKASLSFNSLLNSIKIDVEQHQEAVETYNIRSVPTLLLLKQGKAVEANIGAQTYDQVSNWLFQHLLSS